MSCVFSFTAFQSRYSQSFTLVSETGGGWESCMAGQVLSFAGAGSTVPPTIRRLGPSVKHNLCVQGIIGLCVHALPNFSVNVGGLYIKEFGWKFAPHPGCARAVCAGSVRVRRAARARPVGWASAGRARLVGCALRVWWRVGRLGMEWVYFRKGLDIGAERRIVGIVGSTDGGHRNGEGRAAMNRMGG